MTTTRTTLAHVAAATALVLAAGGGGAAVGAAGLATNSVGSPQLKPGAVKRADIAPRAVRSGAIEDGQVTGADVAEGSLSRVPRAAVADRASNVMTAAVGGDGTLHGSTPGVAARSLGGAGFYEVTFPRGLAGCAWTASLANPVGAPAEPVVRGTVLSLGSGNRIEVEVNRIDGTAASSPFMVVVAC